MYCTVAAFVSDLTESPVTVKFDQASSQQHLPPPLVRLRCSAFGQPEPVVTWKVHPQLQHNSSLQQQQVSTYSTYYYYYYYYLYRPYTLLSTTLVNGESDITNNLTVIRRRGSGVNRPRSKSKSL